MEQPALADAFAKALETGLRPWMPGAKAAWPDIVNKRAVSTVLCPSDGYGGTTKSSPSFDPSDATGVHLFVSNYLGVFSGLNDGEVNAETQGLSHFLPERTAVFGVNRGAAIRDMTDGSGKTLAVGEYLTGTTGDQRGYIYTQRAGSQFLFVANTPNNSLPDSLLDYPTFCAGGNHSEPLRNLPCVGQPTPVNTVCSRSMHPGGVNGLLADGAVRFFNEEDRPGRVAADRVDGGWEAIVRMNEG